VEACADANGARSKIAVEDTIALPLKAFSVVAPTARSIASPPSG
jgi:hypothetical protein